MRSRPRRCTRSAPDEARSLVEAVLGQRRRRLSLAVNFAPSTATAWEVLIDGPAFFPRLIADIEAATSDVHILIFGFKDGVIGSQLRDLLVRKVAEGVSVRLLVEAGYSQPNGGSKAFYRTLVDGGVQVTANEGAFFDLDGLLGRAAARLALRRPQPLRPPQDRGDRRPRGIRRRPRHRGPLRQRGVPRRHGPARGPGRRPGAGGVPPVVELPGRPAPRPGGGPRPVLPAPPPRATGSRSSCS